MIDPLPLFWLLLDCMHMPLPATLRSLAGHVLSSFYLSGACGAGVARESARAAAAEGSAARLFLPARVYAGAASLAAREGAPRGDGRGRRIVSDPPLPLRCQSTTAPWRAEVGRGPGPAARQGHGTAATGVGARSGTARLEGRPETRGVGCMCDRARLEGAAGRGKRRRGRVAVVRGRPRRPTSQLWPLCALCAVVGRGATLSARRVAHTRRTCGALHAALRCEGASAGLPRLGLRCCLSQATLADLLPPALATL